MATIRTVDGHNYRINRDPPPHASGYSRTSDGWLVRAAAIATYMPDSPAHEHTPGTVDPAAEALAERLATAERLEPPRWDT